MGKRTNYEPGTFCWVELATTDQPAAKAFYTGLFGWDSEDLPIGDGAVYTMARVEGDDVAAVGPLQEQGAPPHWSSYVSVESADAATARATANGGTVVAEPFDVFDSGRMAVLSDPAGALVSVWQASRHLGAGRVNEIGCWCWNELATPDIGAVEGFYAGTFDWTVQRVPTPEGAPAIAGILNRAGWGNGNMRGTTDQPPAWLPYFAVESCADTLDRIGELGGTTLAPPVDIPSGRAAAAADPQGAAFGLAEGELDD